MNQVFENSAGGGKIYPNKRKTRPSQPGLSGFIKIERDVRAGSVLWISGWVNEPRNPGEEKTIGIKVQLGQHGQSRQTSQRSSGNAPGNGNGYGRNSGYQSHRQVSPQPQNGGGSFDDDIPFAPEWR